MTFLRATRNSCFSQLAGLYLILDQRWDPPGSLSDVMRKAGEVGVKLVQYRNKLGSMQQAYEVAKELREIADEFGIVFVVNDRCDLAMAVGADGVHLGQADLPLPLARNLVGQEMLIGVSTHTPHQVQQATEGGADYLGFGPIFPTGTKSDHDPVVGIHGMKHIRNLTTLPIFAIGGIRPDSVNELRHAGANGVAVASGVLDAEDRSKAIIDYLSHLG